MSVRGGDRSVRHLDALERTAASSRVLNLLSVADSHDPEDQAYVTQPFFLNPVLNESIVLKHRLRRDERFVFDYPPTVATKVILPFERKDLKLGGQSFFVGQRGWLSLIEELSQNQDSIHRDVALLQDLDELPSLDPFLLKEHLHRKGYVIAPAYFAISDADMHRMQAFVGTQIQALIDRAFPNRNPNNNKQRMANLILSTTIDERLEPLRLVMRLDAESYREGIFSWKGFLYYKWALNDLIPHLADVLDEIPLLQASNYIDSDLARMIETAKADLIRTIRLRKLEVQGALLVYDDAYRDLTQNDKPMAFRDFLMNAPSMFLVLGERIGVIAHIVSFWRYRFPAMTSLVATTEEIVDILQDFAQNLEGFETIEASQPPAKRKLRSVAAPQDDSNPYSTVLSGRT